MESWSVVVVTTRRGGGEKVAPNPLVVQQWLLQRPRETGHAVRVSTAAFMACVEPTSGPAGPLDASMSVIRSYPPTVNLRRRWGDVRAAAQRRACASRRRSEVSRRSAVLKGVAG